jgi:fatty-acyl-CoA synthase
MPAAWRDWLLTRHPLPDWPAARSSDWTAALDNDLPLPPLEVGPSDLAVLPYTSGTTGNAQGLHAPAPQPDAQRGRQRGLGQRHLET